MSFFDEADDPPATPRTATRRRPPSGGGRRPPSDQQAIQVRRLIAAAVVLVLVILLALGVKSCSDNAHISSLKDYANGVSSLIQQSDQSSGVLFRQLSGAGGVAGSSSGLQNLQNQINQTSVTVAGQLSKARSLAVPDDMRAAHGNVVLAMQMRRDGVADIAAKIQSALGTTTSKDAVSAIATDMARFYASDVVYKGYATDEIAAALHAASIGVGGTDGVQIDGGQFLPDIQWLTPTFIAGKLGSQGAATPTGKPAPGLHGHSLDSVSVGGNQLQSGSTNTVPASPAPTFTLSLTNGGTNTETNVICKVTVSGTSASGQTVIPQTTPGQSTTCDVHLSSSPPAGSYTVTATVVPVPGEKNTANNTLSFPVTFQ